MKRILSVLLVLVMIIGMLPMTLLTASAAETATISLASNKGTLTSDKSSISWQSEPITVTVFKNKGNAIRVSDTAHFRMYQDHTMNISCSAGNITKIIFNCESSYYSSLATAAGGTTSGTTVTVDLSSSPVASWTSKALAGSQSRIKSISVIYEAAGTACTHPNATDVPGQDATCTAVGYTAGKYCPDCEKYTEGHEVISMINHTYVDGACSSCGAAQPPKYIKTDLSNISAQQVVIITMKNSDGVVYAMSSGNGTGSAPTAVKVTVTNDAIETSAENIYWNISNDNGNLTFTPNGDNTKWLYCTNANNGVRVGTNANNIFTVDGTYGYLFNKATSRYVGVYNNADWRCYTTKPTAADNSNIKDQTLAFYVKVCTHSVTETETVAATCGVAGSVTVSCVDCGKVISTEEIAALEHSYVDGICEHCGEADPSICQHTETTTATVEATCTAAGSVTVTCANCGEVQSVTEIPALGHAYGEFVTTTEATCTTAGVKTQTCANGCGVDITEEIPALGHNYVDGVCANNCGAKILSGTYYIAAKRAEGNYWYMTSDLGTASTKRYQAVDSDLTELPESITLPEANNQMFEFIYDADTDTYVIKSGDNYLGWSSGNSGALVDEASAKAMTLELVEGQVYYHIYFKTGDETRNLTLNNTSGNNYFAFYTSAQANDLYLIPVAVCKHENTTTTTVDATCTTEGSETVVCGDCGKTVETTVLEKADHTYVDGECSECGASENETEIDPITGSATINFATTDQRVSQDTNSQVWSNGGLTVTNNKSASTNDIIDSSNPVRFYKSSDLIFAFNGMTKIEVTCNTAAYATALVNSISDANAAVSVNDKVVTIVLTEAVDSFTVTLSSGQVRVDSITVTASTCKHSWGEWVQTSAPTCTATGVNTSTCTLCGEVKTETVPATGHTYTYVDGSMTCACGDVTAISTIAEAKAYTSTSQVYYIKGVVTYVSGKNVYIEDATGAICVYFATAPSDIALGDEIVVWDTMTAYNGLIETTNTTAQEYLKVSSGNALPAQTVTIADLLADTTKEYLAERVVIENVTIGVLGTNNTALTDDAGNTINIYKAPALSEDINENDTVTVTAIVSTYNGYQLLINPGTAATDVVETEAGEEEIVTTVTIAEAKAGTAGEYYQVEGVVTYVNGRNVYIQDATGGIVVYLTANAATTKVGDKVKAYGALKVYNGLIELDAVDETNAQFYSILSSGNTVDAQEVTIAGLLADTTNEYLAEKVTLSGVYVSYASYNSSYGNVTYKLYDSNGNFIEIYRVTVASEAEVVAVGSQVNVTAVVGSYNGYQLVTTNDKITVTGTCAHETTELVNAKDATCTEVGYTGDTMCVVCGYYTARGEETPVIDHNNTNGSCSMCEKMLAAAIADKGYLSFETAVAAAGEGDIIKLMNAVNLDGFALDKSITVDLNGWTMEGSVVAADDAVIYGMDSCTTNYEADAESYFNVTGVTAKAALGYFYYNGVFYAYEIKITHVSLKPGVDALGYKAEVLTNAEVLDQIESIGFKLWVNEDQVVTRETTGKSVVTLRLKGIMAANGGEMDINAVAFVTFKDGSSSESKQATTSMMKTIAYINDNWTSFDADKQAAVTKYVADNYEAMKSWSIANIYVPKTEEVPAE